MGHIPGALLFDWNKDINDPVRRNVLSKQACEELLQRAGLNNDTKLILYGLTLVGRFRGIKVMVDQVSTLVLHMYYLVPVLQEKDQQEQQLLILSLSFFQVTLFVSGFCLRSLLRFFICEMSSGRFAILPYSSNFYDLQ